MITSLITGIITLIIVVTLMFVTHKMDNKNNL